MAMPEPNRDSTAPLKTILSLVGKLTPPEKKQLREKLDDDWVGEWNKLANQVQQQSKGLPPISEEEIDTELKSIREDLKAERAKGSN